MSGTVPHRAGALPRWYSFLACFFLLDSMQAFGFIDRILYGAWDGKPGDKITQTLNLLLIGSSVLLFGYRCSKNIRFGTGSYLIMAAIGCLFLTCLWSFDPSAGLRQAIVYLFVALGSISLVGILTADQYMQLLGRACHLAAWASIALLAISSGNAYGGPGRIDFEGIFEHKNFLGEVMVIGALTSLHALRSGAPHRNRHIGTLLLFTLMAVQSRSATSWLTILACCGVDGLVAAYRAGGAYRSLSVLVTCVTVPLFAIIAINPDPLLEMIGKDPTLTGRTEIWAFVIDDILRKPLQGWGYSGFWEVENPFAAEISNAVKWVVPQAHNGLLELLLEIGLMGTGVFLWLLCRNMNLAVKCLSTPDRALGLSALLCCGGIILLAVSEPVLLNPTQPQTGMFLVTGLLCEEAVRAARRRRVSSAMRHPAPARAARRRLPADIPALPASAP